MVNSCLLEWAMVPTEPSLAHYFSQKGQKRTVPEMLSLLPKSFLGLVDKGGVGHEFGDVRMTAIVQSEIRSVF